ncbi:MAG: iron-containing alcohol dehydrogenase [Chloroflexota bacterium]|nr:iron-containing alcohol dehydrogenase [Chloroflexota bacterium]
MTTIWSLPQIEIRDLTQIEESRPTALITGARTWAAVNSLLKLPIVVQAEPDNANTDYLESLASGLPEDVEVVYGVGAGLVADVAKYVGYARRLPVVLIPSALSVDGLLTAIVAARIDGTVEYITTGPAKTMIIDWEVIRNAPQHIRGAGITELLTIVTGLLDWRYAAERNRTTPETRFVQWAAGMMAAIAQQAFKISTGVGRGNVESLRNLLDLLCLEVQLTNQMGHNRPQEGSEQFFAYAIEPRASRGRPLPYADMVGPGILIAGALHGQDIAPIRDTLLAAGIRLGQLRPDDITDTLRDLPNFVRRHNTPFSILNDFDATPERINEIMLKTGLNAVGIR